MAAMREEDVTRSVAAWLDALGWCVLSVHVPGTQGGLRLRPSGGTSKSEGAVIPDILAVRNGCVVILESKPEYCEPDVAKVRMIATDARYRDDLGRLAAMAGQPLDAVIVGICFGGPLPQRRPADVVLFRCTGRQIEAVGIAAAHRDLFR